MRTELTSVLLQDVKQIAMRLGPNYKWKKLTLFDINKVWHLMDGKTMERYMCSR